jgi:hypothetical protein
MLCILLLIPDFETGLELLSGNIFRGFSTSAGFRNPLKPGFASAGQLAAFVA